MPDTLKKRYRDLVAILINFLKNLYVMKNSESKTETHSVTFEVWNKIQKVKLDVFQSRKQALTALRGKSMTDFRIVCKFN